LIDSAAVETFRALKNNVREQAEGVDALGCDIEMDDTFRAAIRLDIDSCEFVVNVIEDGLPAQCRKPIRKVASDIEKTVNAGCRYSQGSY